MISGKQYLDWQTKLKSNSAFRRFWAFWGIYSVFFIFIAGVYLLVEGKWKEVLLAFIAFIFARVVISLLIFTFYKKPRPYQALGFLPLHSGLIFEWTTGTVRHNSFPSDHALSFISIAGVLGYYFPLLGICLAVIAVLNGAARVILGYHYVIDVLAGWLIGMFAAFIAVYWLAPLLFTH